MTRKEWMAKRGFRPVVDGEVVIRKPKCLVDELCRLGEERLDGDIVIRLADVFVRELGWIKDVVAADDNRPSYVTLHRWVNSKELYSFADVISTEIVAVRYRSARATP